MPLLYDDALVRSHYKSVRTSERVGGVETDPQPPVTYSREFGDLLARMSTRKDWLTGYGLDNNAVVLVVGCGFGYLIEFLRAQGISQVWGLEPGSYYWDPANDGEWDPAVKALVAQDWIGSGTEQASLDALPGVPNNERFGWIVDEDAASCHTDAELPAFIAGLEARLQGNVKGRIVHIVSDREVQEGPFSDPNLNSKTIVEWSLVAPDHTWVRARDGSTWRGGVEVVF